MDLDPNSLVPGCENFYWREFIYLPSWGRYANPSLEEKKELIKTAKMMEKVRVILGNEPIKITSGFRPPKYNKEIGGASRSAHIQGLAADWQHKSLSADECREMLVPHLEALKIRMERLPGSSWVHLDRRRPGVSGRYFTP